MTAATQISVVPIDDLKSSPKSDISPITMMNKSSDDNPSHRVFSETLSNVVLNIRRATAPATTTRKIVAARRIVADSASDASISGMAQSTINAVSGKNNVPTTRMRIASVGSRPAIETKFGAPVRAGADIIRTAAKAKGVAAVPVSVTTPSAQSGNTS